MIFVVLGLIAVCVAAVLVSTMEWLESDDPIGRLCDEVLTTRDLRQQVRTMPLSTIAPTLGAADEVSK